MTGVALTQCTRTPLRQVQSESKHVRIRLHLLGALRPRCDDWHFQASVKAPRCTSSVHSNSVATRRDCSGSASIHRLHLLGALLLTILVRAEGIEPPAFCLRGSCSDQLSYARPGSAFPFESAGWSRTTVPAQLPMVNHGLEPRCSEDKNHWSRRKDSNLRPCDYEPPALSRAELRRELWRGRQDLNPQVPGWSRTV